MRSSEDNADDEFVFVANKVVTAPGYHHNVVGFTSSLSSNSTTRISRSHPRLNHLQPIPTTLDLMPSPVQKTLTNVSNTTTARAKATPLPPELIELLPPHLRENTIPDYSSSTLKDDNSRIPEQEDAPERPPLPTAYCPGDYSNLDDSSPTSPSVHNYAYLSDLVTSDALSVLSATHTHVHGTRASSLTSSRPSSRNGTTNTHTASHTAPAALGLTDSGISSGSSSISSSSNSSRSNSSRSLPREGSRISLNGRPSQPPSPKFARSSLTSGTVSPSSVTPTPPLTKVSYTAVLASDGERASMYRKLEALTPTPSPLLNNFRANSNPQAAARTELKEAAVESRPHTKHVATSHTTLTAMGQCQSSNVNHSSSASHTPTSTPNQTPNHTPTPGRKSKVLVNGVSSSTAGIHKCRNETRSEGSGGWGGREEGGGGRSVTSSPMVSRRLPSTSSSSIRNTPVSVSTSSPLSSEVHSSMGQISDHPANCWTATPPSSPELRRAWNVVGVPVTHHGLTPTKGRSPEASPIPRSNFQIVHSSDPDCIYDNLVVRHPPLAAPVPKSAPMASVPPISHPHSPHQYYQSHQSTPTSRRMTPSPASGKPPSPPTQRRSSRSPTPTGGWVGSPGVPVNPQYIPYYPPQEAPYGGCWIPVWGSSPQLCQTGGGTAMYPAYIYNGPPGGTPGPMLCEGRSHSCDRMQTRPSPPPSPRNGRRSASPWRGGSASPVGPRHHSPSPDPCNGRPPRPRRPPMRKSKTVEVGFLGVGAHPPAPPTSVGEGMSLNDTCQLPVQPGNYIQVPPHSQASPESNQMYVHHLGQPVPVSYLKYANQKQRRIPNFDVIHEQIRKSGGLQQPCHYSYASSPSPSLMNGSSELTSPSLVSSTCYNSSETVNPSFLAKQGQTEVAKTKVTYKSSFYKCMKNLLRPMQ